MKPAISFFLFLTLCILALIFKSSAQGKGDTWCFGDSATIRLVGNNFIGLPSCNLNSIEASASISDNNGNLLFYCGGYTTPSNLYVNCYNATNSIMQNGDSIHGNESITNGILILPFPDDSNKYYLFTTGVVVGTGWYLYYSTIDISLNSGNGGVVQKNIQLSSSIVTEKIAAVRHGNGRDWWLISHQFSYITNTNTFTLYLITPNGVSSPVTQSIGSFYNHNVPYNGNYGEIQFSNSGNKLLCVGENIIDLFDFDRCTGLLSNYQNLAVNNPSPPFNGYYGCSFSHDGSKIYISNWDNSPQVNLSCQLFQFDLNAANIPASKTIIFSLSNQNIAIGQHQIARNNKIYIATSIGNGFPNTNYGLQNMNLSVINDPDSVGGACNFTSYTVPLGGRRSYLGLPNIPNYNLGADEGSFCDTLLSINNPSNQQIIISVYPNPAKDFLFINIKPTENKNLSFTLFNSIGQKVTTENIKGNATNYKINTKDFSEGIYFWKVELENKFSLQGKIILLK